MIQTNRAQANNKIIEKIEEAKASVEITLDHLPDSYFLIKPSGEILKGNHSAARLMDTNIEEIIGKSIREIFDEESWLQFTSNLKTLIETNKESIEQYHKRKLNKVPKDILHEIFIYPKGKRRYFQWNLSIFMRISNRRGPLIQVHGRDITDLITFKSMIEHFFSAIPLGILTIDEVGQIQLPVSKYLNVLFDFNDLKDKDFFKLICEKAPEKRRDEIDSIKKGYLETIGKEKDFFQKQAKKWPNTFILNGFDQQVKKVQLNYHSISHDRVVNGMLVIIDFIVDNVSNSQTNQDGD